MKKIFKKVRWWYILAVVAMLNLSSAIVNHIDGNFNIFQYIVFGAFANWSLAEWQLLRRHEEIKRLHHIMHLIRTGQR